MKRPFTDMCNDSSGTFGECPRAKKSKPSKPECDSITNWAHLPDIIIHEIFDYLCFTDRKNASSACKRWRQNVYHRKWWCNVTFSIEQHNLQKAKYFTSAFGTIVSNATVMLNSLSIECMEEFITLMQVLSDNHNLKSLIIVPSHCRFEFPPLRIQESEDTDSLSIVKSIKACLPYLSKFSIGCIEDLAQEVEDFLRILDSEHSWKVKVLGLASVKDDPGKYEDIYLNPSLIEPFHNLEILSIDYDQLSDECLRSLNNAGKLKRLVVHLHGVRMDHPGTSSLAWSNFKLSHPQCELRLTIIHAFKEIETLHSNVLRKEMPLSQLKVFFCETVNIQVLEYLSTHFSQTLTSLLWVDSLSQSDSSWLLAKPFDDTPDPFILISWLCRKLEQIVFYGYKYWEENLIAIARLRGENLSKLEIAEDDILFFNPEYQSHENCRKDIPLSLKKHWSPVPRSDLHPVICNPTAGDSDEYLLPIVLADLQ